MSNIQPYNPNQPASLVTRSPRSRPGRAISQIVGAAEIQVAQVAGRAAIESAKLDALQGIASQGLHAVAIVSQQEVTLAQLSPHSSGRLAAIGDIFALSAAEIVSSTPRRLG